jgi:4-hydroxy-tetrahydrodipicolinate synthase
MFKGVYTALVTPFTGTGALDEKALRRLVDQQIEAGVQGLVPVGTTGESPTVSHDENIRVIEVVVEQTAGRVPVVAGTGSNSTEEAIQLTERAKKLGANACLQVVPYYNRPNQEGLYQHFAAVAEAVDLPIILYNHPGRTGRNMEPETVLRLARHKNIAAIKEASGNLPQMMEIIAAAPVGFSVLSGDDNLTLPLMAAGGHGVISVASHLAAADMVAMCKAVEEGRMDEARRLHYQLMPLCKALNVDTNPIPVKYALARLGRIEEKYRLPLTPLTERQKAEVDQAMKEYGLLK